MKKQAYSLSKIAAELAVSKAAVSLVLNGKARSGGISEKLEKRILDFCGKINYKPNIHAQRINRKEVKNIGLLVHEIGGLDEMTPFAEYNLSHVIGGVAAAADNAGYRFAVQLYKSGMDENKIFDWFQTREIDGLIYYGIKMPDSWRKTFIEKKYATVGVSIDPECGLPSINVDNYSASFKLTQYLIKKGHKKFLYIAGSEGSYPGSQRLKGFLDALKKNKIKFNKKESLIQGSFDCDIAEEAIRKRWMNGKLEENAIVCANDNMAIGAIKLLNEAGISIPEKIAVTGADNMKIGRFTSPPLTTFDYLPYELGKGAFKLLLSIIQGKCKNEKITLNTSLQIRGSA
jgi:LacI family repressor for deo operon, udp, cdd, tsx, nupC, and nupG